MAPEDMEDLAWQLAVKYHEGQMYGNMPYVYHLIQVRDSASGYGVEHRVVAMLHDILEDTACTEEELRDVFSDEIVDAVVAVTKVKGESYVRYLDKVSANKIAHTVKIHDTLANLTESVKTGQRLRILKYSRQMACLIEG